LDDAVAFVLVPAWAGTLTLNAFGLLASLLIVTGVYGMAAYSVSRRSREIGIRSAIGAQPWQILRAVLGRTAVLLIIGASTGLVLGFAATRVLQHVVYQATPQDPVVLVVALVVVSAIGVGAASLPARRALRIDPVRALRDE
jgi:ABC-type antimicrobial peptide transport system permease subunit